MTCDLIENSNAAAKAVAPGAHLSDAARIALLAALEDERSAEARHAAFVAAHGAIVPFAKILKSRRRRIAALSTMAKAYGLAVPKAVPGAEEAPPASLAAACATSAEDEADRLIRYDRDLIPAVADYPGLATVMSALRDRTRTRHLPAFRRALAAANGVPDLHRSGHGHGQGHGHCHSGFQDHAHDQASGHSRDHALGVHHRHSHGACGGGRCHDHAKGH